MADASLGEHKTSAAPTLATANTALDSRLPIQSNHIIYRGITNDNGTGCHTSSALQLLFHCFPRLSEDLLNLANVSANYTAQKSPLSDEENKHVKTVEKEFVYQLSWFFYLLANAEDITAMARAASSSAATNGSPAKEKKKKRKKPKRKKKEIDGKKAAAIDAFVAKSREGKTNMNEWRNLVDSMKEINRKKYDEALGQVMSRRSNDEERNGTRQRNEQVQHIGNLGGGPISDNCELTLEGAGDAIDPAKFYEQLMTYTIEAMEARHHINTNNVGDAAIVFRCLIATLEFSINNELKRLDEIIDVFEIDNWNDGETKDGDENLQSRQRNAYELRSSLSKVRDSMEYEWKGNLLSRIVGISQTGAVSSENIITTTTITRTKKNGNIERPIPIPWQLPVLEQTDNKMNKADESTRRYFASLATSLRSVTICPNPIRGYNWTGLVKSGDVNEETTITKMDIHGNIVDEEDEETESCKEKDAPKSTCAVEPPPVITESTDCDEKKGSEEFNPEAQSDDISMLSTTSRTIGTQTECDDDVEVKTKTVQSSTVTSETTETAETNTQSNVEEFGADVDIGAGADDTTEPSSSIDTPSQSNAIKFAVKKDACYAAAVSALYKARRTPPRNKTKVPTLALSKNERDVCYAAAVAALAGASSRDLASSGMQVSFSPPSTVITDDFGDLDSDSDSSMDSKVPSADNEPSVASSETHSSAIDTPSDIDNLSLGSWTDSEADEEKKTDSEHFIKDVSPVVRAEESDANAVAQGPSIEEKEESCNGCNVVPSEIAHSECSNSVLGVSALNSGPSSSSDDDSSTSSSASSSTSSTGSDSTSSTDSSSTSSSSLSLSSSDSSSSDGDVDGKESGAYNNNSNKRIEWTTRKETRFCQPLPRNLIFHLKRFAFTQSGHGEKLAGPLDIPEDLNLRTCCLEQQRDNGDPSTIEQQYCYQLTGALVHVDPVLSDDEKDHLEYGAMSEGHYVTFIRKSTADKQDNGTWIELDDEFVRLVGSSGDGASTDTALKLLSGCDVSNNEESCKSSSRKRVVKEKERRYATLVVYSRKS